MNVVLTEDTINHHQKVAQIIADNVPALLAIFQSNGTLEHHREQLDAFFTAHVKPELTELERTKALEHIKAVANGVLTPGIYETVRVDGPFTLAQWELNQVATYDLDAFIADLSVHPETKDHLPADLKPKEAISTRVDGPKAHKGHGNPRDIATGLGAEI